MAENRESETKYFSEKLELLVVHDAVEHFKNILWGIKFTILTESKALTYHLNLEKQLDIIARWIEELQDCNFSTECIEGFVNPVDYPSRYMNDLSDNQNLENLLFSMNKN